MSSLILSLLSFSVIFLTLLARVMRFGSGENRQGKAVFWIGPWPVVLALVLSAFLQVLIKIADFFLEQSKYDDLPVLALWVIIFVFLATFFPSPSGTIARTFAHEATASVRNLFFSAKIGSRSSAEAIGGATSTLTVAYYEHFLRKALAAAVLIALVDLAATASKATIGLPGAGTASALVSLLSAIALLLVLKTATLWYRVWSGWFGASAYEAQCLMEFVRKRNGKWPAGKPTLMLKSTLHRDEGLSEAREV